MACLPSDNPLLAAAAALPGAGREAQDLDLDAAALQGLGQDVRAHGGDADRPAAHGTGIVDQQGDDSVAEFGLVLDLETQRHQGIDDNTGQARRIQNAFFQVELPGPVLLRHQFALQTVGQARRNAS